MNELTKSLEDAIKGVEKKFGKGSIMAFGAKDSMDVSYISTGSLALDDAIGGGFPQGRIVEIYGPQSSAKTTLAYHAMAEAQKLGQGVLLVDAEQSFDPSYAAKVGLNTDNMLISQPDSGEQALQIVEDILKSGEVGVIVVDSVAALTPRAELEGAIGDSHMGLLARLMGQAMRKLLAIIHKTNTVVIFINQTRMNIGGYGSPIVTPGGQALKFAASVRIELRARKIDDGANGIRVYAKIVKNKVAPPFKEAEFDVMYNEGISKEGELLDIALKKGILIMAGSWVRYNNEAVAQGKEGAKEWLKKNPEIVEEIKEKL
jgi:recombination protein RecA